MINFSKNDEQTASPSQKDCCQEVRSRPRRRDREEITIVVSALPIAWTSLSCRVASVRQQHHFPRFSRTDNT